LSLATPSPIAWIPIATVSNKNPIISEIFAHFQLGFSFLQFSDICCMIGVPSIQQLQREEEYIKEWLNMSQLQ